LLQWRENIDDFDHMIDQLFGEATFEPDGMGGRMHHPCISSAWVNRMRLSITQAQYHAFAKLIATECAKLCKQNGEDVHNGDVFTSEPHMQLAYDRSWGAGSYECAELIRKQFEVDNK
jgi:hypothetical protein